MGVNDRQFRSPDYTPGRTTRVTSACLCELPQHTPPSRDPGIPYMQKDCGTLASLNHRCVVLNHDRKLICAIFATEAFVRFRRRRSLNPQVVICMRWIIDPKIRGFCRSNLAVIKPGVARLGIPKGPTQSEKAARVQPSPSRFFPLLAIPARPTTAGMGLPLVANGHSDLRIVGHVRRLRRGYPESPRVSVGAVPQQPERATQLR